MSMAQMETKCSEENTVHDLPDGYYIPIQYNKLSSKNGSDDSTAAPAFSYDFSMNDFDEQILTNPKELLCNLRSRLSLKVGVDCNELIISSHMNGKIFKDDNKRLYYYGIGVNLFQIYIEKGTRDISNVSLFKFHVYVEETIFDNRKIMGYIHEIEPDLNWCIKFIPNVIISLIFKFYEYNNICTLAKCIYYGSIELNVQWKMTKVKKEIYNKFNFSSSLRIRDFHDENKLTQIYYDNCNLEKNIMRILNVNHCYDGINICCQETLTKEYFTSKYILLNVARVYKLKKDVIFEEFMEISFGSDTQIFDERIRKKLFQISNGMIRFENKISFCFMTQETFEQLQSSKKLFYGDNFAFDWYSVNSKRWKMRELSNHCKTGDILFYTEI
eukprot:286973_1